MSWESRWYFCDLNILKIEWEIKTSKIARFLLEEIKSWIVRHSRHYAAADSTLLKLEIWATRHTKIHCSYEFYIDLLKDISWRLSILPKKRKGLKGFLTGINLSKVIQRPFCCCFHLEVIRIEKRGTKPLDALLLKNFWEWFVLIFLGNICS